MNTIRFKFDPKLMRVKKIEGKLLGRHKVFVDVYMRGHCIGCINNNKDPEEVTASMLKDDVLILEILESENIPYDFIE